MRTRYLDVNFINKTKKYNKRKQVIAVLTFVYLLLSIYLLDFRLDIFAILDIEIKNKLFEESIDYFFTYAINYLPAIFILITSRKKMITGLCKNRKMGYAIVHGVIMFILAAFMIFITVKLFDIETRPLTNAILRVVGPFAIGSIMEEMYFRKYLKTRLWNIFEVKYSILLVGIMFSFAHYSIFIEEFGPLYKISTGFEIPALILINIIMQCDKVIAIFSLPDCILFTIV